MRGRKYVVRIALSVHADSVSVDEMSAEPAAEDHEPDAEEKLDGQPPFPAAFVQNVLRRSGVFRFRPL